MIRLNVLQKAVERVQTVEPKRFDGEPVVAFDDCALEDIQHVERSQDYGVQPAWNLSYPG